MTLHKVFFFFKNQLCNKYVVLSVRAVVPLAHHLFELRRISERDNVKDTTGESSKKIRTSK